jgi:hypothetical protein
MRAVRSSGRRTQVPAAPASRAAIGRRDAGSGCGARTRIRTKTAASARAIAIAAAATTANADAPYRCTITTTVFGGR